MASYETSYNELQRLKRKISSLNEVDIKLSNLDTITAGLLKQNILDTISVREKALSEIIMKAN